MLPGSALEKLLCSFSPAGDKFALAGPDGRVRVFDTGTARLLVTLGGPVDFGKANGAPAANGHLVESHTCIAWVPTKEKGKKKQTVGSLGVVLGTAAGDVKLYDVQLGELKWRAVDAVQGGVRSLAFSSEQGLIATGNNGSFVSLNVADGEVKKRFEASKYAITSIAFAQDGKHVFGGGSSMQLWDMADQSRAAKYTGHPTEVRAVAFVPGQPHAVSAASGERQVAVWEVPPAKKSKKQHPAVTTLNLEDPATQLDATCVSEGETFNVAAVSEGGEAYVWLCHRESVAAGGGADGGAEGGRPGLACQLVMRVRVGEGAGKGSHAGRDEVILGIRLQAGPSGPSLLVARGTSAKPIFETLAVPPEAPAASADVIVSLRPIGGVLLPGGGDAKGPSSAAAAAAAQDKSTQQRPRQAPTSGPGVTVIGADNIGKPVVSREAAEAAAAAGGGASRKRSADDDDAAAAATRASAEEEEVPDLPEGEVPLGERVAELETRLLGGAAADEEAGPSAAAPMPAGSSKADSLSVLLTQAIRSNDRALLERCMATSNPTVIANTVARIVPMDAALFLKAAVDRLVSKPNRAVQLVPWIRAVLHHHTAYLMSAPGVQPALTSLFQAIDSRVKLHDPLLRLYGRLGLVLHHSRDKGQLPAEQQRPGPEVVLEDDLEEEPEAEDPFAPALGSDGEDASEDEDDDDDDEENEFDAMLADGPKGRDSDAEHDDDEDDSDLGSLLDEDDE
ncbi:hypothetical protein PLESTB_001550400 [Pleodorina starrii]|uniref:Small-subunit processome Utp12 domain-containing protein n=1 Tax=Pleodorina starrii TaxID=330485 RepID=A0A9W6BX82_9CHLO|nr:hypothetical protein PLESTM_001901500 [Pleodorina starrii]GLC59899.1 hypothetical protein PLESTB_001550400 [Pleodorina starrii]GLC70204.1 hypothetical protein PLESTF_000937600 [Pleodorina starrii]